MLKSKRLAKRKVKTRINKKLLQSRIMEDNIHRYMSNPQNEPNIPLLTQHRPRNLREMMQQRMLMSRGQTPQTIIQQPYQTPYQNLRDRNDQKEKDIADYKRLHEEEKNRTKQLDTDKKNAKKEIKQLKEQYEDEKRRANEFEKNAAELDKINKELQQLAITSKKQVSANQILEAQQDLQTTHAKLQELKLREIELETANKANSLYHDNKMKQVEIEKAEARIKALDEVRVSSAFSSALDKYRTLEKKRMNLEYQEEKEKQYMRLEQENRERQMKLDARKTFIKEFKGITYLDKEINEEVTKAAQHEIATQDAERKYNEYLQINKHREEIIKNTTDNSIGAKKKRAYIDQMSKQNHINQQELHNEIEQNVQSELEYNHGFEVAKLKSQSAEARKQDMISGEKARQLDSDSHKTRLLSEAAIQIENISLQKRLKAQEDIYTQNLANQKLSATIAVRDYATNNNIPFHEVANNLDQSGVDFNIFLKPHVMKEGNKDLEEVTRKTILKNEVLNLINGHEMPEQSIAYIKLEFQKEQPGPDPVYGEIKILTNDKFNSGINIYKQLIESWVTLAD
jgi:hypothetical protein